MHVEHIFELLSTNFPQLVALVSKEKAGLSGKQHSGKSQTNCSSHCLMMTYAPPIWNDSLVALRNETDSLSS